MQLLQRVLAAYELTNESVKTETFGSGLINHTWKVTAPGNVYILQRVNHLVFKKPEDISYNIVLIADYLKEHHPDYFFVAPVTATNGDSFLNIKDEGYFRMFPFVQGSVSIDIVEKPEQAYEAAQQFGKFTKLLSSLDIHQLRITIPSFHDLTLRYQQFLNALNHGNKERINESDALIKKLVSYSTIAEEYKRITLNRAFKLRVTHHDTKISNVLFDADAKGLCVIDLDTVMPGYFISDMGDMMRTYLSPVSEEEQDCSKIEIREDFYKAIVRGYYHEMQHELTDIEKHSFFYAGKFMIYMQAIRFLTDHLNDDVYYGAKYEGHNYNRAMNQATLLDLLIEKENILTAILKEISSNNRGNDFLY